MQTSIILAVLFIYLAINIIFSFIIKDKQWDITFFGCLAAIFLAPGRLLYSKITHPLIRNKNRKQEKDSHLKMSAGDQDLFHRLETLSFFRELSEGTKLWSPRDNESLANVHYIVHGRWKQVCFYTGLALKVHKALESKSSQPNLIVKLANNEGYEVTQQSLRNGCTDMVGKKIWDLRILQFIKQFDL